MNAKNEMNTICHVLAWMGLSCVHPYMREKSRIYNKLIFVPTVIQVVIVLIEIYIVLVYPDAFFHRTTLGSITDVLQVGGILFAGFVQILENIVKHSLDQKIGKMIAEIDSDIFARHFCKVPQKCSFCKQRSLKPFLVSRGFYLIFLALMVDLTVIITMPQNETTWQRSIIIRECSFIVLRIGVLQAGCHFHWSRLEFVQKELQRVLRLPMKSPHSGNVSMCLARLSKLKRIYFQLWKIRLEINNRFNWMICAGIIVCFCKAAVGFYWVLCELDSIVWAQWHAIFVHFTEPTTIMILIIEAESWSRVTKKMAKTLFDCRKINNELTRKVNRFTYAIRLCPFRFAVMNFFDLNLAICVSMVSAITTYMLYLFSLHPSVY